MMGRFAPSPTGALHPGSLVAAMASWLDVRAHRGRWLVRIEDLDGPREVEGAADEILATLADFGFRWDGPVVRQSTRSDAYRRAFDRLVADGHVYPCGCTRREVEIAGLAAAPRAAGPTLGVYPGTCRDGIADGRPARAWRMRVPHCDWTVHDRAVGRYRQSLADAVGDFVIRRADGIWAYQLAVVVDDADAGVTDVVRGADLLSSTPRQQWLQQALGLPVPRTLHVPLVVDADGNKLSKTDRAAPLDRRHPLDALRTAAAHLGIDVDRAVTVDTFWENATRAWAARWS